jgi:hypothetical protein
VPPRRLDKKTEELITLARSVAARADARIDFHIAHQSGSDMAPICARGVSGAQRMTARALDRSGPSGRTAATTA